MICLDIAADVRRVGVILAEVDGIEHPVIETVINADGNLTKCRD